MNLYLYIPPGSAHPSNMIYGLIYGRLRSYRLQNTDTRDFNQMAILLARRLCARGYSLHTLLPYFQKAATRLLAADPRIILEPTAMPQTDSNDEDKPMIFHLPHHPRGITRLQVREAYSATLGPLIPERRLLIAVSRPKNIRDRVCRTRLPDLPGTNPSDFIITGDDTMSPQILPQR
jgi:hypothetical protein